MAEYAIYLRKSRADMEAEARGEGETLARHRKALFEFANRQGYHVSAVYQEIVSGDSIAARPQMQALLRDVERGEFDGVIVNDPDRLSRGDGADQAVISRTFRESNTLIITPFKVFNPNNPQDEDMFDFRMFFSRFEYKQMTRRMQLGRARSAAEGNWQSGPVPFGFECVRNQARSGYTLKVNEAQAEIVRMIYKWYDEGTGKNIIANRLNDMGITTKRGNPWIPSSIWKILKSRLYIGDYVYKKHTFTYKVIDGKKQTIRKKNDSPIIALGCFPAIVDRDLWERVQDQIEGHVAPSVVYGTEMANPLCGLLKCGICGKTMTSRISRDVYSVCCRTPGCKTVGCNIGLLEDAILEGLRGWTAKYTPESEKPENGPSTASDEARLIQRQIETVNGQMNRLHDLVEQGAYSVQTFVQRRDELTANLDALTARLGEIMSQPTEAEMIIPLLPQIQHIIDAYPYLNTPADKNALLKSVLEKIVYHKTERSKGRFDHDAGRYVTITLYPKVIPHEIG